jgi:integrase
VGSAGRWRVYFYDFTAESPVLPALEDLLGSGDLHERALRNEARHGTPVIVAMAGQVDPRVNLFFRTSPMAGATAGTWRRYAYALVVWLEFLAVFGKTWDQATAGDVEAFKDWRLTDHRNDERVQPTTFDTDRAALNTFYRWASGRYGVANPVASVVAAPVPRRPDDVASARARDPLRPTGSSRRQVKWMLRSAFEQWRDIGLRGYGFDGLRRPGWAGIHEDRDAAFVDGLFGTGLRLREWASVLDIELPVGGDRRFSQVWLSAACIKGGREGRRYRIPRSVLTSVAAYADPLSGSRAEAIRRAQGAGRYERVPHRRIVTGYNPRNRVLFLESASGTVSMSVDVLGPDERRALFRRTAAGLEPLALWLSISGMPRRAHSWQSTFQDANARIQRVWEASGGRGVAPLFFRAHMARHSFALKWYSILSVVWEQRIEGFDERELKDLRDQFGDVWFQLAGLLGHADPATTRDYYLEPFSGLQLDYLMSLLDEEEQQAVDALVRVTAVGSGRTLAPARLPAAETDGSRRW